MIKMFFSKRNLFLIFIVSILFSLFLNLFGTYVNKKNSEVIYIMSWLNNQNEYMNLKKLKEFDGINILKKQEFFKNVHGELFIKKFFEFKKRDCIVVISYALGEYDNEEIKVENQKNCN